MSGRFVVANRDQMSLLPYDLRDWIPQDDLVHFVIAAVESIPVHRFRVNQRGTGDQQYHPHMMLALLIYCYANGIFGSRRIERATYRDIAVRFVCANTHPDHTSICRFRRDNPEAFAEAFLTVLQLAAELKLLRVGTISVDGTKLKANASKDKSIRYDRAGELEEQLKLDIKELTDKAEAADQSDEADLQKLPEEIARREKLLEKMQEARKNLEERARARQAQEQAQYEKKLSQWHDNGQQGNKPSAPKSKPTPEPKEQTNMTDGDSRLMRKNSRSEFQQAYNAQAVVDADGTQLVLGCRVSTCASDANELVPDVSAIPKSIGKPSCVLADSGYASGDQVHAVEQERIDVLVSVHSESKEHTRKYDFRPRDKVKPKEKKDGAHTQEWVKRMAEKMETPAAKALYKLRKQTVEPVFGIIKQAMGFRQFLLRGLDNVESEWRLVVTAYNIRRLFALTRV